ncbi:hypothetical protein NGM33_28860 [Nocardiopsis dassonvillei]|uniref:hypothetical protein n=1 Tax=Nocardiopsis dassonvillei TaxID=2014 RepID=UPI0020A34CF6|nr:hypothetical protein [Nocardiopsis dassonvillei]MCP3017349.1 hypothetical protein [Nocardiopsis dassonvillei]
MATWKLVTDSPASNAVTAGIGVASATVAMDALGLHPLAAVGGAAVGSLLHLIAAGMESPDRVGANLARWGGAGAWSAWALAGDPWTMAGMGTLAVGSAAGAALGPWLKRREKAPSRSREGGNALVLGSTGRRNQEWTQRISRVCSIKGAVCDTVAWDNGCGYDVTVTLPEGGATRQDLARNVDALASDANLPDGCGIRAIPSGQGRRTVILSVSTVNRLNDTIDYPTHSRYKSVLEPIVFGETASGEPAEAVLRQASTLITGPPGSGKTTLLHGMTASLVSREDVLVWHLDLNGGGLSQPWVDLWIDGKIKRCPIDWPASTEQECVHALEAAIRIAKHRKTAYRKLKRANNTTLLPISPKLPMVLPLLDEGAEATKSRKLAPLLAELQNIARDSGLPPTMSALSPTGEMVPPTMRRNTAARIAMYSPDEEQYAYLTGWGNGRGMSNDDLSGPGTGFLSVMGGPAVPFRAYNITPQRIEEIARRAAESRPELDAASAQAAGEAYATRWERVRQAFDIDGQVDAPACEPEVAESEIVDPHEDWTAGWGDPFGGSTTLSRPSLPAGADGIPDAEVVEDTPIDDILVGALRVMADLGSDRATRRQLADRLTGGDEDALRSRMTAAGCCPVHSLKVKGKDERGWYRKDVEAAMSVTAA